MAARTTDEVLRLLVKTEGAPEILALAREVVALGDAGEEAEGKTAGLLDELSQASGLTKTADQFRKVGAEVVDLNQRYSQAQARTEALAAEMAKLDAPTKRQQAAFRRAKDELENAGDELARSRGRWSGLREELTRAGIASTKYSEIQSQIEEKQRSAGQALRSYADDLLKVRAASQSNRDRIEEQDAAFRKQAGSVRAASESLRLYRERAAQAAAGTRGLGQEAAGTAGAFGRLRGFIASAVALVGIGQLAAGIKGLLGVGAAAESTKRSLENLYGSQEAGNRAFGRLKELAADNGLAFQFTADQAKKLMAFGLDPLNGSLQALVDQNAAVGGSEQDLEGKVLALGQAWAKQKLQGEEILQLVERGVPVWSLLEKATGKNVTQLQKLSEQGKLGRETISLLLREIGKANDGAASRGLSSLSGLFQQVSARWTDFLNKVTDNGVSAYFKTQIQSLLGSTGNLDSVAKRVANGIIGIVETLRRLATQIGPVVATLGNATLGLVKHADALVLVAQAYAAVKIAGFYQGLAKGLASLTATSAATAAVGASATATGSAIGGLAGVLSRFGAGVAGVVQSLKLAAAPAAALWATDKAIGLIDALFQYQQMLERISNAQSIQRDLQGDQVRLGQQLQSLYRASADVAVQSGERVSKMTRDQAADYKLALEQARRYYEGVIRESRAAGDKQAEAAATERWRDLGTAVKAAGEQIAEIGRNQAAATALRQLVDTAVSKFDELRSKGKTAKESVADIFDGIDFAGEKGLGQAVSILEQVGARGKEAGAAITAELRTALLGVAAEDLPKLKAAADAAFAGGSEGARQLAAEVNRIGLSKLGVDVEALKSGFTASGRAAVDAFRLAVGEVDKLGLSVEQRSQAIAQAFDAAFKQAGTKSELEALRKALADALSAGDIGLAEFRERTSQADAALAELGGTGKQLGADVAQGAAAASDALQQVTADAQAAAPAVGSAGDSATAAGSAMKGAAEEAKGYGLALTGLSEKAAKLAGDAIEQASSVSVVRFAMRHNDLIRRFEEQKSQADREIADMEQRIAALDPDVARRKQLMDQFDLVGADVAERRLQAEKQLAAAEERAAEARKRDQEQAEKSADQVAAKQRAAREEGRRDREEAAAVPAPVPTARRDAAPRREGPVEVVIKVASAGRGQGIGLSHTELQELARALLPPLINELEHRRSVSNR